MSTKGLFSWAEIRDVKPEQTEKGYPGVYPNRETDPAIRKTNALFRKAIRKVNRSRHINFEDYSKAVNRCFNDFALAHKQETLSYKQKEKLMDLLSPDIDIFIREGFICLSPSVSKVTGSEMIRPEDAFRHNDRYISGADPFDLAKQVSSSKKYFPAADDLLPRRDTHQLTGLLPTDQILWMDFSMLDLETEKTIKHWVENLGPQEPATTIGAEKPTSVRKYLFELMMKFKKETGNVYHKTHPDSPIFPSTKTKSLTEEEYHYFEQDPELIFRPRHFPIQQLSIALNTRNTDEAETFY